MFKPYKYLLSLGRIIGIILTSFGLGLIIGLCVQWWGYILAIIVVIFGIWLICCSS